MTRTTFTPFLSMQRHRANVYFCESWRGSCPLCPRGSRVIVVKGSYKSAFISSWLRHSQGDCDCDCDCRLCVFSPCLSISCIVPVTSLFMCLNIRRTTLRHKFQVTTNFCKFLLIFESITSGTAIASASIGWNDVHLHSCR